MVNIFLSASIPLKERSAKYYDTADRIAIRDAVRALATIVVPHAHLFWGGHPSITPLIRDVVLKLDNNVAKLRDHVTLYQSEQYRESFPEDNFDFEDVRLTPKGANEIDSNRILRMEMLGGKNFAAGIFIGGMEGVEIEYEMFRSMYPSAPLFPVASTGGGAKLLFDHYGADTLDPRLLTDYAYMSLFQDLLRPVLG